MAKHQNPPTVDSSSSSFSSIIENARKRFSNLVSELKKRGELGQSLEFAVAKVAAELESLECLQREILNPSFAGSDAEKIDIGMASLGKILPHYLVNFDKLVLQCGVQVKGTSSALISGLFEKNPEFTEVLVGKH